MIGKIGNIESLKDRTCVFRSKPLMPVYSGYVVAND